MCSADRNSIIIVESFSQVLSSDGNLVWEVGQVLWPRLAELYIEANLAPIATLQIPDVKVSPREGFLSFQKVLRIA